MSEKGNVDDQKTRNKVLKIEKVPGGKKNTTVMEFDNSVQISERMSHTEDQNLILSFHILGHQIMILSYSKVDSSRMLEKTL